MAMTSGYPNQIGPKALPVMGYKKKKKKKKVMMKKRVKKKR